VQQTTPTTGKLVATPRFLTLTDVGEILNISSAQTYALVRSQALRAIKVGGRGQWRVESTELEAYIARCYEETAQLLADDAALVDDESA
jgi:excisionase family DNA binding protein